MTKWICNECTICMGGACKCETHTFVPEFCVINKKKQAYWVVDNTDLNTATIESVETKTTLPDWCKVGEWVYVKEESAYAKVESIGHIGSNLVLYPDKRMLLDRSNGYIRDQVVQARLRPYNAKEMRGLVGKVLEWGNNSELVISYNEAEVEVYVDRMWCTAEYLMDNEYTIDGKPCGKFEHLNDNGEWVE